jgi:3-phenylpropionate/cinnamic acid dioxygenase small subunit
VSNLEITASNPGHIEGCAVWTVHFYHPRTAEQGTHHGRCAFTLSEREGHWRYARKRISLMNDCVNAVLDFYLL